MARLLLIIALLSAADAHAAKPDGDVASRAQALLDTLGARKTSTEDRRAAAEALLALGPGAVDTLKAHLQRERVSSDADRRAILTEIRADVPDEKGRFRTPGRGAEYEPAANLDWLEALLSMESRPRGYGEVVSDVAAIRALAASDAFRAGTIILNFAFTDIGLVYRDECGRYLRDMAPHSLPALIKGSNSKKNDKRRYANYQLERLDREDPNKAMHYAPADVRVAILEAFGATEDRSAVLTVLNYIDDVAPPVRAAARQAWMDYVTGPPPPPAPMKKLALPGGKLTEEEMPLWLNSLELADVFLRERYEQVMGEKPPRRTSLEELSKQLFAHYDAQRKAARDESFASALDLVDSDPAAAAAAFDAILGAAPEYAQRAEMAEGYVAHAKQLKKAKDWPAAAVAFGKAYGVDPQGPHARRALAEQHYAQGRAQMAAGGDPRVAFELALELDPEHPGAQAALAGDDPDEADAAAERGQPAWLLYAGIAGGVFALLLFAFAAVRRQHG